jgi:hypothetical protein
MFASGLLVMFESLNSSASALNVLVVPLAVQEMVMAVWMIAKGFADVDEDDPALQPRDRHAIGAEAGPS